MLKKAVFLLSALIFLLLINYSTAEAATDNYLVSVPKVKADKNQMLGTVAIREDADYEGFFKPGDRITVTLPAGVEYAAAPAVGEVVYAEGQGVSGNNAGKYLAYQDNRSSKQGALRWKIVAAGDNFIAVEAEAINGYVNLDDAENILYFTFNEPNASCVDIDADVIGDIKVEIDAAGTAVNSGYITAARVVSGETMTTISEVNAIELGTSGEIGTIRIMETAVGILEADAADYIQLTLPAGFYWKKGADFTLNAVNLSAEIAAGWGEETLCIEIKEESSGNQPGFIALSGLMINVPADSEAGELEIKIDGNEVTKENVVAAQLVRYRVDINTGYVPTVQPGQVQRIADVQIKEAAAGILTDGEKITLLLPEEAQWVHIDEDSDSGIDLVFAGYCDNKRGAVWQVVGKSKNAAAALSLEDMEIIVGPEFQGDAVVLEVKGIDEQNQLLVANIQSPTEDTYSFAVNPAIDILDNSFTAVKTNLKKGDQYYIGAKVTNLNNTAAPVLVITKVTDCKGNVTSFNAVKMQYYGRQTNEYYTLFTPNVEGKYTVEVFVWSNWLSNGGKPLAEGRSFQVAVD